MAAGYSYTCDRCGFTLEAWDEENPYIEDYAGGRHHFYHPCEMDRIREIAGAILGYTPSQSDCDQILKTRSGTESACICRSCEKESEIDLEKDQHTCTHCGSASIERIYAIAGKPCIKCQGNFLPGELSAIS